MRKLISTILIIIGLAIILYPLGRNMYSDYQQHHLLAEWEKVSQILVQELPEGEEVENGENEVDNAAEELKRIKRREAEEKSQHEYIANNMEGVLIIDKINLKLPILTGTAERNFLISLGSLENTAKPGEIGNYAIAGHRNFGYGRHLNRIDELEDGDTMIVQTTGGEYQYMVTEKLYVLPNEVWVLEGNGEDREITLITCHPVNNPTHRLIVKGKFLHNN